MRHVRLPGESSPGFIKRWKSDLPALPKWARDDPHVSHWAYESMKYRAKVMRGAKSERPALISEAKAMSRRYGYKLTQKEI